MVMIGGVNFSSAATASATMSAPTWLWTERRMFSPVLTPGPTTMGGLPSRRVSAFSIMKFSGGTTLHRIAPVTSRRLNWYSAKRFIRSMQI